ncbi:MAG TPA: recombinase [Casimicrobiaceae bacterium]|nr:recombinase [Casimicrobiaceae bacterium]
MTSIFRGKKATVGIDRLVSGARADAPLAERVAWMEQCMAWVRARGGADAEGAAAPATRIRFLLQVLERHPERKLEVSLLLRGALRELSAIGLLCETGLPHANAFMQELVGRLASKLLPAPPAESDMASVFRQVFPEDTDAEWVTSLPPAVLGGIGDLLQHGASADGEQLGSHFWRDAADALLILASHVQAIGLSQGVRQRTASERPLDTPFAGLSAAVHAYVEDVAAADRFDADEAAVRSFVARCLRALRDVSGHLENYGVSIDLVYQLERAQLSLLRMQAIIDLRARTGGLPATAQFVAALIRANDAQDSVRSLLRENLKLLTRRIVESARRTGDHYITRDGTEYRQMLFSAAIGGAVTGMTVLVKIATVGHGLPLFIDGLVASANYALSFVMIHLLHGTLATKQPAMTAAAMAHRLNAPRARGRLRGFVEEVANLVRSQVAAILGNLLLVAPVALALQAVLLMLGSGHLPDSGHARDYVESLSLWSAAPFYAAFTGVLLWLSAVIAGWFENWATFRRLPEAIARSPRILALLGPERATRAARVIENNVAALGGNVSLGFLLGMEPVIATFFGLPLEVRHVTLSTGQLALASWSYGAGIFSLPAFWWAVAGIVAIGFMNLTVSFGLALSVAIRSTGRGAVSRRRLRRAVFARVRAAPLDFLLPPKPQAQS